MYVKALLAFFLSFVLSFVLCRFSLRYLRIIQGQNLSVKGFLPNNHQAKKHTPSMGGLASLLSTLLSIPVFCDIHNTNVWVIVFTIVSFGAIGLTDDLKKLFTNSSGLSASTKLILQLLCSAISITILAYFGQIDTKVSFAKLFIDFKIFYFPFAILMISFISNAVNVTDGLDGLAAFCIFISSIALAIITAISTESMQDIIMICSIISGSNLAFLWFNSHPADVFMGDVSSLSFGAALAVISVITKTEFAFAILSGVFVLECMSTALQLCAIKLKFKRKPFLMAPIHHHFELLKLHETKITTRFWICAILLAAVSLGITLLGMK